jgi:IclR family transcriptional regulator, acetate operon repressor
MADSPVLKAITILRRLAERAEPVGVQQLASDTGLNVSTVHRLLQLMAQDGMVAYDAQARVYSIGVEGIRFATLVLGSGSLTGRVRPIIADLAAHLGETCAFTLYEPGTFSKVIAIVERGPHPLGYDFAVGTRDGIHAGASGKPILAFLPDEEIERFLHTPLPRLTEHTLIDPDQLRRQIRQIRKRGYATSRSERVAGAASGIGAPVFSPKGQVIGSVVVTIPSFRWRNDRLEKTADIVMQYARRISAILDPALALQSGARPMTETA